MVVTDPPRPALIDDEETIAALDALIEEARRRARRRRRRLGAAALMTLGLCAAAVLLILRVDASEVASLSDAPSLPVVGTPAVVEGGELAIMDYEDDPSDPGPYGGRRGWYGVSAIDKRGRLEPLVRCPDRRDWCGWVVSADWSRGGRYLAISVITTRTPNPNGIHVIDTKTGVDRHIGQAVTARDLDWSPDGSRLAFSDGGVIKVLNVRVGGSPRAITKGASPSWSPDGLRLAFASGRVTRSSRFAESANVYIIRADGTAKRLIKRRAAAPAWSPTDDLIAYRSDCGINLMTSSARDVTPPSPFVCEAIGVRGTPAWSPDGKRIAIGAGRISADRPYGTFVMNSDGSNLVRVSRKARGNGGWGEPRPTWRPRR